MPSHFPTCTAVDNWIPERAPLLERQGRARHHSRQCAEESQKAGANCGHIGCAVGAQSEQKDSRGKGDPHQHPKDEARLYRGQRSRHGLGQTRRGHQHSKEHRGDQQWLLC